MICKYWLTNRYMASKIQNANHLHFKRGEHKMRKAYTTKTRNMIMDFLEENKDMRFSAASVFEYLQGKQEQINLATVYRNLERLTEEGVLLRNKSAQEDCSLYQYVEPHKNCHEHLHLQCKSCGKIMHLECDFMKQIAAHLLEEHGFELDCKTSALSGICDSCRTRKMRI